MHCQGCCFHLQHHISGQTVIDGELDLIGDQFISPHGQVHRGLQFFATTSAEPGTSGIAWLSSTREIGKMVRSNWGNHPCVCGEKQLYPACRFLSKIVFHVLLIPYFTDEAVFIR